MCALTRVRLPSLRAHLDPDLQHVSQLCVGYPTCALRGSPPTLPGFTLRRSNEAAQGVEHDILLLVAGIQRLGAEKDGEYSTTFGTLFKDEILEQQLESLVGSLRAAKKRGILTFEGQMLLQGGACSPTPIPQARRARVALTNALTAFRRHAPLHSS